MNIAAILQKLGMEYIGRYYSIYRGIVIDNEDPEHLGRILVHVPSVQSGLRAWARCKAFVGFNHAGVKFITPKIGDVVFVEFEKGLPLYPIWSYHGWALEETPEEFRDNNTCGFITPFGHKFYVQDNVVHDVVLHNGHLHLVVADQNDVGLGGAGRLNVHRQPVDFTFKQGSQHAAVRIVSTGGAAGGQLDVDGLGALIALIALIALGALFGAVAGGKRHCKEHDQHQQQTQFAFHNCIPPS